MYCRVLSLSQCKEMSRAQSYSNVAIGPLKQPLRIFKFQTSNFLLIEILVKIINPFPQNRQQ